MEILSGTAAAEPVSNATTTTDSLGLPVTPESALTDSATTVTNVLPDPLQFGDFAALGLTGWMPAGIIRWSLEVINVASGLPWFWTIVAGSAFWKLVCVPLTIKAARTAAILQPHQQEVAALQERVTQASRNPAAFAKANREMKAFYHKLGVSPFGGLIGFLQLPITLGIFFAVKKMCDLPVEQMKYSGFEMFPDLTVTDPTLILPIAMTVAVNAQLLVCFSLLSLKGLHLKSVYQIGSRDVAKQLRPMMYFFHFLTIPGFFILKGLPVVCNTYCNLSLFLHYFVKGLIVSILTTAILTTLQSLIMRVPQVRRSLGIPMYVPPQAGRSVLEGLRALLPKDGDIKTQVAQARRETLKRQNLRATSKGQ